MSTDHDKYVDFTELAQYETYGVDYFVETINRNSNVTCGTPHGGDVSQSYRGIEPGSETITKIIAELGGYNYYSLNAIKVNYDNKLELYEQPDGHLSPADGNRYLHVTSSHHLDNAPAMSLFGAADYAFAMHGVGKVPSQSATDTEVSYIGGKDRRGWFCLYHYLRHAGFVTAAAYAAIAGTATNNIVNQTRRGMGTQIEATPLVRKWFLPFNAAYSSAKTAAYAQAIYLALERNRASAKQCSATAVKSF